MYPRKEKTSMANSDAMSISLSSPLWNAQDLSAFFGVHIRTMQRWLKNGVFEGAFKIYDGEREEWRLPQDMLIAHISKQQQIAAAQWENAFSGGER
jgi:tellurite resistance-related uncharacterized protein